MVGPLRAAGTQPVEQAQETKKRGWVSFPNWTLTGKKPTIPNSLIEQLNSRNQDLQTSLSPEANLEIKQLQEEIQDLNDPNNTISLNQRTLENTKLQKIERIFDIRTQHFINQEFQTSTQKYLTAHYGNSDLTDINKLWGEAGKKIIEDQRIMTSFINKADGQEEIDKHKKALNGTRLHIIFLKENLEKLEKSTKALKKAKSESRSNLRDFSKQNRANEQRINSEIRKQKQFIKDSKKDIQKAVEELNIPKKLLKKGLPANNDVIDKYGQLMIEKHKSAIEKIELKGNRIEAPLKALVYKEVYLDHSNSGYPERQINQKLEEDFAGTPHYAKIRGVFSEARKSKSEFQEAQKTFNKFFLKQSSNFFVNRLRGFMGSLEPTINNVQESAQQDRGFREILEDQVEEIRDTREGNAVINNIIRASRSADAENGLGLNRRGFTNEERIFTAVVMGIEDARAQREANANTPVVTTATPQPVQSIDISIPPTTSVAPDPNETSRDLRQGQHVAGASTTGNIPDNWRELRASEQRVNAAASQFITGNTSDLDAGIEQLNNLGTTSVDQIVNNTIAEAGANTQTIDDIIAQALGNQQPTLSQVESEITGNLTNASDIDKLIREIEEADALNSEGVLQTN